MIHRFRSISCEVITTQVEDQTRKAKTERVIHRRLSLQCGRFRSTGAAAIRTKSVHCSHKCGNSAVAIRKGGGMRRSQREHACRGITLDRASHICTCARDVQLLGFRLGLVPRERGRQEAAARTCLLTTTSSEQSGPPPTVISPKILQQGSHSTGDHRLAWRRPAHHIQIGS